MAALSPLGWLSAAFRVCMQADSPANKSTLNPTVKTARDATTDAFPSESFRADSDLHPWYL